MTHTHDVISAFLDDEPFDATELAAALADPEGRTLLIDLVALRHIVQPDETAASTTATFRSRWRPLVATAAMLVALAGGYFLGERRSVVEPSEPPAPTRIVQETTWQTLPAGGGR
jgi:ABC-type nitrate/sulfonate/bicarbonate transport system substrate-binding protein